MMAEIHQSVATQRAVLTDIEGTTSSIAFVKDVLFPYARMHLAAFVARNRENAAVQRSLQETAALAGRPELSEDEAVRQLLDWIDEDRKVTPLKTLQGFIWAEGYAAGQLRGHVHPDAAAALRAWRAQGITLYVYSSGSTAAQKLLFSHSDQGDLTPLFSGYFDTTTGSKLETASYTKIRMAIGLEPGAILFLSDHLGELDAARAAGLKTAWLNRSEAPVPCGHSHPEFTSFAQIDPFA